MQQRRFVLCGLLALLLSAAAGLKVRAGDLNADLAALEAMRNGLKTPADAVEKRGAELLKEYPADEDRGKIYYQLAFILSQSGMMRREKIQEYSEKALKLPLEPKQRLTLYVCLGDSYRRGAPAKEYPGYVASLRFRT